MTTINQPQWTPLSKLARQFDSNLAALRLADSKLADQLFALTPESEYFIAPRADHIILAHRPHGSIVLQPLPNPAPPSRAREIAAQLYPAAQYNQPVLIAGLDQGWLWDVLYKLKCFVPTAPGLRLPLYLLASHIERLWVVMHYQNWTELLRDPRVQLAVGPNAAAQIEARLQQNPRLCLPKLAVTVEPQLWACGENLDAMLARSYADTSKTLAVISHQMPPEIPVMAIPAPHPSRPLRILGITSRYTTFLQHSMRDWLAALQTLGHQTKLLIERADHEVLPALVYAEECKSFRPDLILIIDHPRLAGLPPHIPCVMWIQDRMPHIYRPQAGASQSPTDYVIGYGRQECTQKWSYPASRFMPAMVGVNETRFTPRPRTDSELSQYNCDVSFVSHASTPADVIIQTEINRATSPNAKKLLDGIYQRLLHLYDAGNSVTHIPALQSIIQSALDEHGFRADIGPLTDMVSQRLNNALLRHQSIRWIAGLGVDLRLYGRGWESHPEFKPFARGIADNQNQLALIYQASQINLQVTPFGSAHQRLFEGLCAGAFFLLRSVTGDAFDLLNLQLWQWCQKNNVHDAASMLRRGAADPQYIKLAAQLTDLMGNQILADPQWFYAGLEEAAMSGFSRSAATLWPEYEKVSFWTPQQLTSQITHFLANPNERHALAQSMRQSVLQWHTYAAISKRMLSFINADISKGEFALAA